MDENLYHKFREELKDFKAIFADHETLVLNRRDYSSSQVSDYDSFIRTYKNRELRTLSQRSLATLVGSTASNFFPKESMQMIFTSAAFSELGYYLFLRRSMIDKIIFPNGFKKLNMFQSKFLTLALEKFKLKLFFEYDKATSSTAPVCVVCDAMEQGNVKTAINILEELITPYIFFIKDYTRSEAYDEREFVERKGISLTITLEGHAFQIRTDKKK